MEDVDLVIPDVLHGINAASVRQPKSLLVDSLIRGGAVPEVGRPGKCPHTGDLKSNSTDITHFVHVNTDFENAT